jgi:hypothetical protein
VEGRGGKDAQAAASRPLNASKNSHIVPDVAVGLYRFTCVADRISPASEDVAVIDLAFDFTTGGFDAGTFAALVLVNDTDVFQGTATDAQADTAFDAFEDFLSTLASVMGHYHRWTKLVLTREDSTHPIPNTPVRTRVIDIDGTEDGNLPPQVALDVTLKTWPRRHWGRFYVPGIWPGHADTYGRADDSTCDLLEGAYVTLCGTMAGNNWFPIVLQAGTPATGIARTVRGVACDNVFDVIRRRRWDAATYRKEDSIPP